MTLRPDPAAMPAAGHLVHQIRYPSGAVFEAVINDLLYEPVDAIVNAANGGLSHGGGIAAQIADAAGPALVEECRRIVREHGHLPVSGAVVTTAGRLPFRGVVHAVGPRMGDGDEEEKIVRTLHSAFRRAVERRWVSMSYPALGSGIYGISPQTCARAYLRAVDELFRSYPHISLRRVRLCLVEGAVLDVVRRSLAP